ncbi:bifunctional non-homologous end joining protein LigD [Salirhabdus euzebyi]|uniref:DNA ligase (ATP) n=1 Tax=Salirhabdus euzebyi TaxID=394506 RepID=A0A841Q956_9BACI|nr:DNA ligase D [Salirhabdus euzebyi]MBB6454797.1 bifunctional non-homologous end joining protein LigD [Salirhabdus euzebyi]
MWKPMLPMLSEKIPEQNSWVFEVKYDGFRSLLSITESKVQLISRNGKDLSENFPEIIGFCEEYRNLLRPELPIHLDGELVILNSPLQANFSLLQQRGRLKNLTKIKEHASKRPATFLAFDLIRWKNNGLENQPYEKRKDDLAQLFSKLGWPVDVSLSSRIGGIKYYDKFAPVWDQLQLEYGEGLIAKRKKTLYEQGKRVDYWLKLKNWRKVNGLITGFDPNNAYFEAAVYDRDQLVNIGLFKHGFEESEFETLRSLIYEKGEKTKDGKYIVSPQISVQINCLQAEDGQLREPMFDCFRFDLPPEEITYKKLIKDIAMLPQSVDITNPDKPLWPQPDFSKQDLLIFLRKVSPYMLPHILDKRLTLIRYPHGVTDQSFYQKHRPDYAPDYVGKAVENGEEFILCNTMEALIWLGNQAAIEYHMPFQRENKTYPDEIVFDLDPPSRQEFPLAIEAAKLLKNICDHLELTSYVKTSGNKGLQVHIPLPENSLSYDETRKFTEAVAFLLVNHEPTLFTIERLKKNRGNKLYVDYIQHAEGKTIVAPFSPRATESGSVSTPLFWSEVKENLNPMEFTIQSVPERIELYGNPLGDYFEKKEKQNLTKLKQLIDNE